VLSWFKKKKTTSEDKVPVPDEISGEEGHSAEAAETVADISSGLDPSRENVIQEVAELEVQIQKQDNQKGLFKRLQESLSKTRDSLVNRVDNLFLGKKEIDAELLDELEEILITADLGVNTTLDLLDEIRSKVSRQELKDPQALKLALKERILVFFEGYDDTEMQMPEDGPFIIMVVGVNGVGKTTTIGKIANKFVRSGQKVLLVAADTFRAAAINQLKVWGERVGVEVMAKEYGSDPSSVIYDGLDYASSKNFDVILIDTAGRLHTKVNLMEELKKIKRVIGKKIAGAPHEIMLILDATTGQNSISQAKLFNEAVGLTGLTLTKLDGTAKGGIVVNISHDFQIPIRFIGIGEKLEDLRDFDPREFIEALFANGSKLE
jgi:fused signal recognition particle receptor